MTELWEILVPTVKNEGKPFRTRYHRVWDKQVYEITGGLTILRPTKGKWVHQGKTYEERNIPVRVACSREQLMLILKFTKEYYDQLAIMAYKISDEVIIFE
jgi:hypothetical protein